MSSTDESPSVIEARARAGERTRRQRRAVRPLGLAVIAAVVVSAVNAHPAPSLHGRGLGVTLALVAFAASFAPFVRERIDGRRLAAQAGLIAAMGAAGVALVALQPRDATALAGGAAVWTAVTRLPLPVALALGVSIAIALDLAAALSGVSAAAVVAITLLSALLGLVAFLLQQSRRSQEQTELLLAQLEDAREEQLRAVANAERNRIAGDLHDVLAHSLSAAAIQLQGTRLLAAREHAGEELLSALDRASALVKDGLANARQAVGALRGDELPGVAQLERLVGDFSGDTGVDIELKIEGDTRDLPADMSIALYRGAQEALTNIARYARGARASLILRYGERHTTLSIVDAGAPAVRASSGEDTLAGVGGGRGLAGMRERIERAGGTMQAGPTDTGWRVTLDVPA